MKGNVNGVKSLELIGQVVLEILLLEKRWKLLKTSRWTEVKTYTFSLLPPQRSCRGVYWFHHVHPSVCRQILCRTITWVVFLWIFWNFISSLPVKRGGSLLFLVGTISNVLVMEIGWTDVGSGGIS